MAETDSSGVSKGDDAATQADQAVTADEGATAKPVRRTRRRTKAADPAAETAPTAAEAAPGEGESPAETKPVKRATRARKTAKKAVAPVEDAQPAAVDVSADTATNEVATEATSEPAPAATPRKSTRTRRKAAPAPEVVPVADLAPAEAELTEDEPPEIAPAEAADAPSVSPHGPVGSSLFVSRPEPVTATPQPEPLAPPAVLFMAPEPLPQPIEPPAKRTRKKGAQPADEPQPVEDTKTPAAEPAEASETDTSAGETEADDDSNSDGSRRRRGRRGRGRGRGSAADETSSDGDQTAADDASDKRADGKRAGKAKAEAADQSEDATDDTSDEDTDNGSDTDSDESGETSTSRRRRRRRRRGGSDGAENGVADDDPPNTEVRVRETRAANEPRPSSDDEVKGVKGSTRLEAKRQRRRDGRDHGRRRPPVLSEAEFLARRESVDRVMVVRQRADRTQIAALEDGVLVEHYVTKASSSSYAGNVYLGKVQNVLPSMEAAFVDVGKGRNAVLYAGEVNWDTAGLEGKPRKIEQALRSGDSVLVQVTKDPIGHKGARLTSQVSLPGRFLVYVPEGQMTGISRKLPENERKRLKDILRKIVPADAGVIIRTAAEGASEEELARDVARLEAQWQSITAKAEKASSPALLYAEPDLVVRVIRDIFNEDFSKLVVQGDEAWATVQEYVSHVSPDLVERLSRHTAETDVFSAYRIDEQIMKALDRKVWLPSGGSLVIDRTEAMTVVDVNTGKFTGQGGNLEETVTRNNLEAAEEIVRQLRLRDIGGMVVVDFIDMVLESNRDLVLRRLTECLGRDRTKHQVAEVTSLGLVQMTRKRVGQGLLEAFSETCEHCKGRGLVMHTEPVERGGGQQQNNQQQQNQQNNEGEGRRGKRGRNRDKGHKDADVVDDGDTDSRTVPSPADVAKVPAPASAVTTDDAPNAGDGAETVVPTVVTGEVTETPVVTPVAEPIAPAPEAVKAETPKAETETSTATDGQATEGQEEPAATPPRRRRRAASRPSGPPPIPVS